MKLARNLVCAGGLVLFAVSAQAGSYLYDCEVDDHGTGWIADRILIAMPATEDSASVYDGIIHSIFGRPISAELTRRSEKSLRLNWRVDGLQVGNVNTKESAQYSAILNTKTHRITVSVELSYFDNQPRGSGKCTKTLR